MSDYIGAMPFLWLAVNDSPGPQSDRGVIETGAIALLSNLNRPVVDAASAGWLGCVADRRQIRDSGLWNVNHTKDPPNDAAIAVLERYIR